LEQIYPSPGIAVAVVIPTVVGGIPAKPFLFAVESLLLSI